MSPVPASTLRTAECLGAAQPAPATAAPLVAGAGHLPEALLDLAAQHVADLRLGSAFNGLLDLIERAETERAKAPRSPDGLVAGLLLDCLVPVRIEVEEAIQRLAVRGAAAEAERLDRDLAAMDAAEREAVFADLTKAQRRALIWQQAKAVSVSGSPVNAIADAECGRAVHEARKVSL